MKKTICLLITLMLCTALAIPAMAQVVGGNYVDGVYEAGIYFDGETIPAGLHENIDIESNSNVTIDGAVRISSGFHLRIRENGTLTITENGSLSGTDIVFPSNNGTPLPNSKIVLRNGAWIRLEFHVYDAADAFEILLQEGNISYTRNGNFITAGNAPACERKNQKTVCADCGEVISTYSGSMLSEGSLAIITAVAGVAVGMTVMFFIMKKKKSAPAEN
ncbi:MAG: FHA domain-containing protein [Firmicutes bacterium]|nr:FHA domain-containing protein [Candidatus Colimorpha enterica]